MADDLKGELKQDYERDLQDGGDALARLRAKHGKAEGKDATRSALEVAASSPGQVGAAARAIDAVGDVAGPVASDVARTVPQFPRAVIGGVRDAVQEALELTEGVGDRIAEATNLDPRLTFIDPETGGFKLGATVTPEDVAAFREAIGNPDAGSVELPDVEDPDTTTGMLVEGITQFLTGFAAGGSALRGAGILQQSGNIANVARGFTQGAIADFTVFDPQEERLSNLVESVPALKNPVTGYLAADGNDSEMEGRIKSVLEGGGLGAIAEPFVQGLRAMRAKRRAASRVEAAEAQASEIQALGEKASTVEADLEAALGEGAVPVSTDDLLAGGVREVEGAVEVEGALEAVALSDAATRLKAATARLQPERFGDAGQPTPISADDVDGLMAMVDELRAEPPRAMRLGEFLRAQGGVIDDGGEVRAILGDLRTRPGLVNNTSGLDMDEAAERAWLAGFFGPADPDALQPTAADLMRLLSDDLIEGRPNIYSAADADAAAVLEARRGLRQELDALGIDPRARPEQVREEVEAAARRAEGRPRTETDLDEEEVAQLAAGARGLSQEQIVDLGGDRVNINFGRIQSEDDIRSVIGQMADAFSKSVDEGRRGVRTNIQTKASAQQINAWETLKARRQGQPLNAEQSLAVRELWINSASKLREVAQRAANNPSEGNLFAFRRMMAVHHSIQREVIAARTETARALQQWQIPVGDSFQRVGQIEELLETSGGIDATKGLAEKLSRLPPDRWGEVDRIVERAAMAKTADAVAEAWQNGLLWAPQTQMVNAIGNTMTAAYTVMEKAGAARLARVMGTQVDSVQIGEATQQAIGMMHGARDALRYASKTVGAALRRGEVGDETVRELGIVGGPEKVEARRPRRISSQSFGVDNSTMLGRTADAIGPLIRVPGNALGAADTFFKTVNYRGELYSQAFRTAQREFEQGFIDAGQRTSRMMQLVNNPPPGVKRAARQAALERTFTNPPAPRGATAAILRFRDAARAGPLPLGHILLPFVNTPANLLRFSFMRSPVAPMFREYREAIARGGADAEIARTQMYLGTAISMISADMAMNGQISGGGPLEPGQREALLRTGWQPYSVKVGDRWVQYNRLDPLGITIGLAADMAEITANTDWAELGAEEHGEAIALAVGSIGQVSMSKTYMTGMSDFFEFMSDPQRYGEGYLTRNVAAFAVPNIGPAIRRVEDPVMRSTTDMMDEIKNRVPGLSKSLPPRLDLWGRPISYQSGLGKAYDAVSPIYSRVEDPEPVDSEIIRLGVDLRTPRRALSVGGVSIPLKNRPEIYSEYIELAGNGLKIDGMGAKDTLNAIVEGRHALSGDYEMASDGAEGGKARIIKNIVTRYRSAARAELLSRHPELIDEAEAELFERAN